MVVRVEGRSNSDQAPSQLSKETTNGKKNTKEVGRRNYDKDQQHRGHCHQDDEGSKFLHVDMVNRFVGHGSPPR